MRQCTVLKNAVSVFSLVISALMLIGLIGWSIFCVYDYNALVGDPSTSGIDYLMLGAGYAIGFLAVSVLGFFTSLLCLLLSRQKLIKGLAAVSMSVFVIGLLISVFLWFV